MNTQIIVGVVKLKESKQVSQDTKNKGKTMLIWKGNFKKVPK
jgi:hypothetical protein